jgi:CBS domain containing-hemolysin-like protein
MIGTFLRHFLSMFFGYLFAVVTCAAVILIILSLPTPLQGSSGWASNPLNDVPGRLLTLTQITAIAALPGWAMTALISELALLRSKWLFALAGLLSAALASVLFNALLDTQLETGIIISTCIGGLFGGLAYWAISGRNAGIWISKASTK